MLLREEGLHDAFYLEVIELVGQVELLEDVVGLDGVGHYAESVVVHVLHFHAELVVVHGVRPA